MLCSKWSKISIGQVSKEKGHCCVPIGQLGFKDENLIPDPHANGSSACKTNATIKIAIKNRTSGSPGSLIGPDQADLMDILQIYEPK